MNSRASFAASVSLAGLPPKRKSPPKAGHEDKFTQIRTRPFADDLSKDLRSTLHVRQKLVQLLHLSKDEVQGFKLLALQKHADS